MKAIDTTLRLLASAGITGAFFGLPLGLAMIWSPDLPELDVEVNAAPMVALAAVPFTMAPAEATSDFGADAADADGSDEASDEVAGTGTDPTTGPAAAPRPPSVSSRTVGRAQHRVVAQQAAAAPAKKQRKRVCETPNPGIERMADDRFEVERGIVDAYAKRPGTLSDLGWVSRHDGSDGKADGFRLGGLRCGNDLHAAGLRNGDVVHAVNGRPVTSIPEAIWAYTKLRKADEIEVRLTRNGSQKTLTFALT